MFWMEICGRVRRGCEGLEINKSFFLCIFSQQTWKDTFEIKFWNSQKRRQLNDKHMMCNISLNSIDSLIKHLKENHTGYIKF